MTLADPEWLKPTSDDHAFQKKLWSLFAYRRDTRQFRDDPVEPGLLDLVLQAAMQAPSVGLSEPWRYVQVESHDIRQRICEEFEVSNRLAAELYSGDEKNEYESLKLAGLRVAPIHLAVFETIAGNQGRGLGRQTMPETIRYSTICSIQNLWLACTALGLGLGWVSILRKEQVKEIVRVDEDWELVAYLCIGWPQQESQVPELELVGWEHRRGDEVILKR